MYAKSMTTGDTEAHIRDIYGIEVSDTTVSRITDKILPIAKEWQQRPLEVVYAVVFLDAIHYHVRSEGQIVKKAVYIAIGINLDGRKDVLGMWVGENESAKYWASILNSLAVRQLEIARLTQPQLDITYIRGQTFAIAGVRNIHILVSAVVDNHVAVPARYRHKLLIVSGRGVYILFRDIQTEVR